MRNLIVVLTGLVAAAALVATPAGAAHSGWSFMRTPNPPAPTGELDAVSCSGASSCTAVGDYMTRAGRGSTLAQRWDGTKWTFEATANPSGTRYSSLHGLSCPRDSFCIAVGQSASSPGAAGTLAERRLGKTWTVQPTPDPPGGGSLDAVSCVSASSCEAVGFADNQSGPLAEGWNGTRWSIQPTPDLGGGSSARLNGVSCASTSSCEAVGAIFTDNGPVILAEAWNGTSWSIQPTPTPDGAQFAFLGRLSCSAPSACEAVGFSDFGTLAEVWDGTSWQLQTTPNPSGGGFPVFNGVACTSTSSCVAAGALFGDSSGNLLSFSERWDGSAWQIRPTADPIGAATSAFNAVACPTHSKCVAVGSSGNGTLAERSRGARWTIQPTPDAPNSAFSLLTGVSCSSSSACTAVGFSGNATVSTLAQRWDGATWSIQNTPDPPGSQLAAFYGLACTGSSFCMAVGETDPEPAHAAPLVERWDGDSWSILPASTPPGAQVAVLFGVSCTGRPFCIAVGAAGPDLDHASTLVEQWDGAAWVILPSPTPPDGGVLGSVSCTSPAFCIAVGGTPTLPFAEEWDGTTWSIQDIPTPPDADAGFFNSVSCADSSHCTAAGLAFTPSAPLILAERWDGTAWTVQRTPSPFAFDISPPGVACPSVSTCTAVASYSSVSQVTLAERWIDPRESADTAATTPAQDNPGVASNAGWLGQSRLLLPAARLPLSSSLAPGAARATGSRFRPSSGRPLSASQGPTRSAAAYSPYTRALLELPTASAVAGAAPSRLDGVYRTSFTKAQYAAAGAAGVVAAAIVSAASATAPGENGLLVYQAQAGAHVQLFTISPDGTGARQITHFRDSDAVGAQWSPNGRQILFHRDQNPGAPNERIKVYVMNADGSGLRALKYSVFAVGANWFPDGRRIVFLTGPPNALGIMGVGGTGLRTIPIPSGSATDNGDPVVSPDGKRIAFIQSRHHGVQGAVFVVDLADRRFRQITPWSGGVSSTSGLVDWSPDGLRLVYGGANVFTVRADGTGRVQLTHGSGGTVSAANSWSPDGKKIAFVSDRNGGAYQVFVMNADGTGVVQLTHGGEADQASWGTHP